MKLQANGSGRNKIRFPRTRSVSFDWRIGDLEAHNWRDRQEDAGIEMQSSLKQAPVRKYGFDSSLAVLVLTLQKNIPFAIPNIVPFSTDHVPKCSILGRRLNALDSHSGKWPISMSSKYE
jgi:hypothetical protein